MVSSNLLYGRTCNGQLPVCGLPAGHTKAQKGYIDSALQGVVAQQKGNGTLFQLPTSQCCTPNQRAPDPFVEMVGGQGRGARLLVFLLNEPKEKDMFAHGFLFVGHYPHTAVSKYQRRYGAFEKRTNKLNGIHFCVSAFAFRKLHPFQCAKLTVWQTKYIFLESSLIK
ncbi:hypothetical protein F7725_007834 [Dissostichus mawsoni]|uniref:Uncharacterized protein n=1 Tax=Dissostichus mawsoni TaxID=36200 RepID=A0A7J5Y6J8_DISMA|nr:hypothetical protein F7725_007834 [Dissostichus mawsoni]